MTTVDQQNRVPAGLPDPNYPMLTRVISRPLFPRVKPETVACPHCKGNLTINRPDSSKDPEEPITWVVKHTHPLVPSMQIVRMFLDDHGGVEVYSVMSSGDQRTGMRNYLPSSQVKLVEEGMPYEVFIDELEDAELDNAPGPEPEPMGHAAGQSRDAVAATGSA